ncbi:MAG: hypothetical protein M3Y66_03705 [Actinomycetota bacterium]|nr:hypothetical protein [Actinomycetota bacterium]
MPRLRLVTGTALLALAVSACGSQSPSSEAPKTSTPSSRPATPSATSSTKAEAAVQALRDRVRKPGTGTFSMVTRTVPGSLVASIRGHYRLTDQQLAAQLIVPQSSRKAATAKLELVKNDAFLQVDEWKKPSRTCWLRTTADQLSQRYGLDVVGTGLVPLPLALLDNFRATTINGKGLIDGNLNITDVLPMLGGSIKRQLVVAKPQGVVPAFVSFSGNDVQVTIPGYALSAALAQSLGVAESQFSAIAADRFEAGLKVTGPVATLRAPSSKRQMTTADLVANRCG